MKIILSRKGFDSSPGNGCVPSPILPGGALCPLPIPEREVAPPGGRANGAAAGSPAGGGSQAAPGPAGSGPRRRLGGPRADTGDGGLRFGDSRHIDGIDYAKICYRHTTLGPLVESLTDGRVRADDPAHLDPDLDPAARPRLPGWRPTFGQAGAAEGHLRNQGVGPGDLFLYFGWFRDVEPVPEAEGGGYRYLHESADRHVLFGWLQVGAVLPAAERERLPEWILEHPHCSAGPFAANDSLYIAAAWLTLPGREGQPHALPGAGLFPRYRPELCLTAPGESRSMWALPRWFHPADRESALTYHGNPDRWLLAPDGEQVLLQSVGRGQEFVLNCEDYPEAVAWAAGLLG